MDKCIGANNNGVALIVEDDEHMRALLASMLRDLGFSRAIEAASAHDALQALASNAIAIALVDLCLAGEDGLSLISAIRAHPSAETRALPIVVVSRAATEASVVAATDAGADGFIAKPLSTATFHRQVSLAFVKRSLTKPRPPMTKDVLAVFRGSPPLQEVVELD